MPVDEVRRASGAQRVEVADARLLRLRDLPAARPLDLPSEELPPGLPQELLSGREHAVWWVAAAGSGKGLLGLWLQARGRCRYLETDSREAVDDVGSGPLFVEFWGSVEALPQARPGLCVAARFAPPKSSGFREVRSPPSSAWLEPLLVWAGERLPAKTRLDSGPALELLEQRARDGSLHTLGEALGLIGLLDEFGARDLSSKGAARVAQRLIEARVQRVLDASAPFASWLRRTSYAALLGMAERALVDSEQPLSQPRSFEQWLSLVPPEFERNVDIEWMRLSLSQIDSAIRPADVERAARRLPPGAFRIVTTLIEARLLRRDAQIACASSRTGCAASSSAARSRLCSAPRRSNGARRCYGHTPRSAWQKRCSSAFCATAARCWTPCWSSKPKISRATPPRSTFRSAVLASHAYSERR
ncbi:MAG: hypothetical protein QM756_27670 [Polyangiaceae bacterium]